MKGYRDCFKQVGKFNLKEVLRQGKKIKSMYNYKPKEENPSNSQGSEEEAKPDKSSFQEGILDEYTNECSNLKDNSSLFKVQINVKPPSKPNRDIFEGDELNKHNRHWKRNMDGIVNDKEKLYLAKQNKLDLSNIKSFAEEGYANSVRTP